VLLLDTSHASVATTAASVAEPSALDQVSWTKIGVTVTANNDGVRDLLTANATTANTAQAPANASTTQPIILTVDVKRVASDVLFVQTSSSAAGRTWFNILTGTVGTTGANHSAVSITSLGAGEWRITLTASTHTTYALCHADADNTLTCTAGHSFLASNASVTQVRATAFDNLVSGVSWSEVVANLQPLYVANAFGTKPGLRFHGAQSITSTEAAVVAALAGSSPAFTFICVHALASADVTGTMLGGGNSGVSTNRSIILGQSAIGSGFYLYSRIDDSGNSNSWDVLASPNTAAHMLAVRTSDGQQVYFSLDGGAEASETSALVGATTIDRVAIGQRPDMTPDSGFTGTVGMIALYAGNLDAAALGRILAYCQTEWGTP
jgi:hypothetical protein